MTREEFKINFSQAIAEDDTELFELVKPDLYLPYIELSSKGLDTLTKIAEVAVEPLFEEIETLRDLCQRTALENNKLRKISLERQEEIERTEIVLSAVRQGCEDLRHQKSILIDEMAELIRKIKSLESDISDLSICEECIEMQERLKENGCYPPMFCILCWNKRTTEMVEKINEQKNEIFSLQDLVDHKNDKITNLKAQLQDFNEEIAKNRQYISALEHDVQVISEMAKMRQSEILGLQTTLDKLRTALSFYSDKTNLEKYVWQKEHHNSLSSWTDSGLMDGVTKVAENVLNSEKIITSE